MLNQRLLQVILRFAITTTCVSPLLGQSSNAPTPCVDVGLVAAVHGRSLTIKNDESTKVYQVDDKTEITRGGPVHLSSLRMGDSVMLWCGGDGSIATDILVNFTHWEGTITAIYPNRFVMHGEGRVGETPGHVTVRLDGNTNFYRCTLKDLKVGRGAEVTGSVIAAKQVQATSVHIWRTD
jgi:Domain of unknown function (DUF5666)